MDRLTRPITLPITFPITLKVTGAFRPSALGGSVSLTAPVAIWVSGPSVAQAIFEIDAPLGTVAGMWVLGRAYSDAGLTSLIEETSAEILGADLIDLQIDDFAFAPFNDGQVWIVFYISDAEHTGAYNILSEVSNTITETIVTASGTTTYHYLMFG